MRESGVYGGPVISVTQDKRKMKRKSEVSETNRNIDEGIGGNSPLIHNTLTATLAHAILPVTPLPLIFHLLLLPKSKCVFKRTCQQQLHTSRTLLQEQCCEDGSLFFFTPSLALLLLLLLLYFSQHRPITPTLPFFLSYSPGEGVMGACHI